MKAETHAMIAGIEEGSRLRAAIADARGLQDPKDWEKSSAKAMKHLWVTDCASLSSYLTNAAKAGCEDKRLEIDLVDLRQILWNDENDDPKEDMSVDQQDKVMWIDTSAMLADPLTKEMKPDHLLDSLCNGKLSFTATAESQITKMKKQKSSSKKKKDTDKKSNEQT
jgi:hypothetical protein